MARYAFMDEAGEVVAVTVVADNPGSDGPFREMTAAEVCKAIGAAGYCLAPVDDPIAGRVAMGDSITLPPQASKHAPAEVKTRDVALVKSQKPADLVGG